MKSSVLLGLVVTSVIGGCFGPSSLELDNQDIERHYYVVFHPPHLDWNAETKTLNGTYYLTFVEPQYLRSDSPQEVQLKPIHSSVDYYTTKGVTVDGNVGEWRFSYDFIDYPIIRMGETMGFNFSAQPADSIRVQGIEWISIDFGYKYDSRVVLDDDSTDRYRGGVITRYENWCLQISGDQLKQSTSGETCDPFDPARSDYMMSVAGVRAPPVERWNEWTWIDDYPSLLAIRDFLNDFDGHHEVRYYDGEVGCKGCREGGL